MTPGVSLESASAAATFSCTVGTVDADYAEENLANLREPSIVCRIAPSTGDVEIEAVLAEDSLVRFIGLVGLNTTVGDLQVEVFSDAAMTASVYDSTSISLWPGVAPAGYRLTRPLVMPSEVTARAVRFNFTSLTANPLEIGAIEIARWWPWPGISPGAQPGFRTVADKRPLVGGGMQSQQATPLRTMNGELSRLAMSIAETRGLDFHKIKATAEPFVYVFDADDEDTWARHCWLARNTELPPFVGAVYRHDTFQFRLVEANL